MKEVVDAIIAERTQNKASTNQQPNEIITAHAKVTADGHITPTGNEPKVLEEAVNEIAAKLDDLGQQGQTDAAAKQLTSDNAKDQTTPDSATDQAPDTATDQAPDTASVQGPTETTDHALDVALDQANPDQTTDTANPKKAIDIADFNGVQDQAPGIATDQTYSDRATDSAPDIATDQANPATTDIESGQAPNIATYQATLSANTLNAQTEPAEIIDQPTRPANATNQQRETETKIETQDQDDATKNQQTQINGEDKKPKTKQKSIDKLTTEHKQLKEATSQNTARHNEALSHVLAAQRSKNQATANYKNHVNALPMRREYTKDEQDKINEYTVAYRNANQFFNDTFEQYNPIMTFTRNKEKKLKAKLVKLQQKMSEEGVNEN